MITYIGFTDSFWPLHSFLDGPGGARAKAHINFLDYRKLAVEQELDTGAIIFSALDLLGAQRRQAMALVADLLEADPRNRVINHPARFLGRYDLLRKLHSEGRNLFNVYRHHEASQVKRWPVFVRFESDHAGPRTPLIESPEDLDQVLVEALLADIEPSELMVCEFLDTATDGVFVKYAANIFGDLIVPRHRVASRDWAVKVPQLPQTTDYRQEWLDAEAEFMNNLPDREQLLNILRTAGIEYGRIDYSYSGGQIQTWEINTNPQPLAEKDLDLPSRSALTAQAAELLCDGFDHLLTLGEPGGRTVAEVSIDAVRQASLAYA